jgi:thiamine-monophosphate kinase
MTIKTVGLAGEFGTIRQIMHDLIYRPEIVEVGPGDDCAVYRVPEGMSEAVSTDTMVEGIHFTSDTMSPEDVGYKLCMANFSDICAMGGEPAGLVISAALPADLPLSWIERCYDGVREACRTYRVNMLGGDITGTRQGIVLTAAVTGFIPSGQAVLRRGAQVGDIVAVTGVPGQSGAGLDAILFGKEKDYPQLALKHRRPHPDPKLAVTLRKSGATSMDDISDGLSSELNELAESGCVTIEIDTSLIPLTEDMKKLAEEQGKDPLYYVFCGGEDYELVFTIPPSAWSSLKNLPVTRIGLVTGNEPAVYVKKESKRFRLRPGGYDHFFRNHQ